MDTKNKCQPSKTGVTTPKSEVCAALAQSRHQYREETLDHAKALMREAESLISVLGRLNDGVAHRATGERGDKITWIAGALAGALARFCATTHAEASLKSIDSLE